MSDTKQNGDGVSTDSETLELTAAEQVDATMRQTLAAILGENIHGGDEDFSYYDVFEWDRDPGVDQFYALALRNPYAFAVTFLPPSTSWRDPPDIVDDADSNDGDGETEFEREVQDLEDEVDLWQYGKRADKLAGIGQFGVLVLEFDDVQQQEVADDDDAGDIDTSAFAKPVTNAEQLTGLRPFSEASIDDVELGGPGSGRWGKPISYDLDLSDEDDAEEDSTVTQSGPDTMTVHHTRVIHIHADELLDDEVRGIERQKPVYNNLIDIERALGAAGQLAYRAAAWGININIDKDFDLEDGGDKLQEHLHRWEVGLENVLRTQGASDVQSLGGEEIDPSGVTDPNIEAISAQTGIPQSVLKGNETGERATTQDLKEWYGKIQERRRQFVEPTIVRALIDRLREYDIIPDPRGGSYVVEWTPLQETSEDDVASIQKTRAEMLKEWTGGNPDDYLSREQQRQFIEDGEFPSEMDEVERTFVDEDEPGVESQFDALQSSLTSEAGEADD